MKGFAVYYIEANVVCMIIFGILLIHNHFNIDRQEKQIRFDRVLTASSARTKSCTAKRKTASFSPSGDVFLPAGFPDHRGGFQMERKGIVVFGSVFVDIKGYPLMKYIPGGRNVGRVVQTHGGVSRNVAEDIANVELRPTFVSVVDDTGSGADVIERLQKHKVNTEYIVRCPDGMGTWLAVFDNDGDVIASISKRPELSPILQVLGEHGDEIIGGADSVVVELDLEVPILRKILALAGKHGKEVYAVVSNMSIAMERRDLFQQIACLVCNAQEAGLLFSEDYCGLSAAELQPLLQDRLIRSNIPRIVVTLGKDGAVYAEAGGESGCCASQCVEVIDTTGAGDAFFSGVAIGLTYGKSLGDACAIGTRLATSVISTRESVCPRFRPEEFGLTAPEE